MADLARRRFRDWEVLRLSTDELGVDVVPGLGGTITSLQRRSDGAEVLHRAPWGLPARGAAPLARSADAEYWAGHPGGWRTVFPNGGEQVSVHGTDWPRDGEARGCWLDWTFTGSSLVLSGRLVGAPFEISKVVSVRGREVTVGETVRNVGRQRVDVMWAHQLDLGGAVLGVDTVLDVPATVVRTDPRTGRGTTYDDLLPWPRAVGADGRVLNLRSVPGPAAGESRQAYLSELTAARATVHRPATGLTVTLGWDGQAWPHLWYELEAGGERGSPWFGAGYRLTLSPASTWPAHGLHEARRRPGGTTWIEPGEARTSYLSVRLD